MCVSVRFFLVVSASLNFSPSIKIHINSILGSKQRKKFWSKRNETKPTNILTNLPPPFPKMLSPNDRNKKFFNSLTPIILRDKPISSYASSEIITVAINQTGTRVVYSRTDRSVRIWKCLPASVVDPKTIVDAHLKAVECLSFNPMTEFTFATVAKDEYVKIWNANTGDKLHEIKCEFDSLKLVRYSNDGQLLVVVDRASNFLFFNVGANYKLIHKFKLDEHIYDLKWFNHDHQFFLVSSHDGSILLYEIIDGDGDNELSSKLRASVSGHNSSITTIAISPKGNYFTVGSSEGVISFWKTLENLINLKVITDVDQSIAQLDISRDGTYLAVAYDTDSNLRIYEAEGSELVHEIPNSGSGNQTFSSIVWFPTKTGFAYTSDHGTVLTVMIKPIEQKHRR